MSISELVEKQKEFLNYQLETGFRQLAEHCSLFIKDKDELNRILLSYMQKCTYANLVYIIDVSGVQISANVSQDSVLEKYYRQDLSSRPFFNNVNINNKFYLSDTYISGVTLKPCISAVHAINHGDKMVGLLVLDLDLEKLQLPDQNFSLIEWRQIKGDPEIRSNLFKQTRVQSSIDQSIDTVHAIASELMCELGVFHIKIHYASSRATIWTHDDPYNYRVHLLDELFNPNIYMLYPKKNYPATAKVSKPLVKQVLDNFKYLRFMDSNLYLKTGSINIMNGMVGITFSCDGNHYLTATDFLSNFDKVYA
jgi:hypothetical protein